MFVDACVIMWGEVICDCVYVYHCVCWRAMKLLLSLVDWDLQWAQPHLLDPPWVWLGQAEKGTL